LVQLLEPGLSALNILATRLLLSIRATSTWPPTRKPADTSNRQAPFMDTAKITLLVSQLCVQSSSYPDCFYSQTTLHSHTRSSLAAIPCMTRMLLSKRNHRLRVTTVLVNRRTMRTHTTSPRYLKLGVWTIASLLSTSNRPTTAPRRPAMVRRPREVIPLVAMATAPM
jgi:hypothetical protein